MQLKNILFIFHTYVWETTSTNFSNFQNILERPNIWMLAKQYLVTLLLPNLSRLLVVSHFFLAHKYCRILIVQSYRLLKSNASICICSIKIIPCKDLMLYQIKHNVFTVFFCFFFQISSKCAVLFGAQPYQIWSNSVGKCLIWKLTQIVIFLFFKHHGLDFPDVQILILNVTYWQL